MRREEFVTCSFDDMCLMPMTCDHNIGCVCMNGYFYDPTILNCRRKYSYNEGPCNANYVCNEIQNLICDITINKCVCLSPTFTWSTNQNACKISVNQRRCNTDSDCNLSELLSCDLNQMCNCVAIGNYHSYFDTENNKCVQVLLNCNFDEVYFEGRCFLIVTYEMILSFDILKNCQVFI